MSGVMEGLTLRHAKLVPYRREAPKRFDSSIGVFYKKRGKRMLVCVPWNGKVAVYQRKGPRRMKNSPLNVSLPW